MVWFRVDDSLVFHPKVIAAGTASIGLWARAGAWSGRELTDGYVPREVAASIGNAAQVKALCSVGLWVPENGGYRFHDWEDFNPLRADVEAVQAAREVSGKEANHIRWHERRGVINPDCDWCMGRR